MAIDSFYLYILNIYCIYCNVLLQLLPLEEPIFLTLEFVVRHLTCFGQWVISKYQQTNTGGGCHYMFLSRIEMFRLWFLRQL